MKQKHQNIAPSTETAIKNYEMSVVARMYCGVDGALYIPKDKSALMKAIKQYTNVPDLPDGESIDLFAND